jgi:predicted NAD/FAD-binding protein
LHDFPDGVFSYLQKMVDRMRGQIHAGVAVRGIRRTGGGITVELPDGCQSFDRVVIATTPQSAWRLLCDPSPDETRWVGRWRDQTSRTTGHFSESMYERRGVGFRTECDCFEQTESGSVGYNCSLNELYDIDSSRKYSFSAHMEDEIESDRILDQQEHVTPVYQADAAVHRHEIRQSNGRNHTYYVGAYLIDGLQEGAITTAMEVAALLGGRTI